MLSECTGSFICICLPLTEQLEKLHFVQTLLFILTIFSLGGNCVWILERFSHIALQVSCTMQQTVLSKVLNDYTSVLNGEPVTKYL